MFEQEKPGSGSDVTLFPTAPQQAPLPAPRSHRAKASPASATRWPYDRITRMTADVRRNQWVKKINGVVYSFGVLDDADTALRRYQAEGPSLHAGLGRTRRQADASLPLGKVAALFVEDKRAEMQAGEISQRTLDCYESGVAVLLEVLGLQRPVSSLGPMDFERLLRKLPWGPTRRTNFVTWVRMMFAWAVDKEVIPALPRYGKSFRGASMRERRSLRNRADLNLLTAEEIRRLLAIAPDPMRAMILLGINGGLGNTDVAGLRLGQLRLDDAIIEYPRIKTAVPRTVPLWPETVEAIRACVPARRLAALQAGKDDLVFRTRQGEPWVHGHTDALVQAFRKLLRRAGLRRAKVRDDQGKDRIVMPVGFYTLRRTFRTVADEAGDQHATLRIMGHTIPGMSGLYVQRIGVERLQAVAEHVRQWLWLGASCPWPRQAGPEI